MKKRVLQLIGSFHQGGSERQAVAITRMLRDSGKYDVTIATLNKDGVLLEEFSEAERNAISEFKLTSFYNANFVAQVRAFATLLGNDRVDLIHTHDFYSNVFGMAGGAYAAVKRVASKRETSGMRTTAQDLVERIALGRAQAVVANSEAVRDYLAGRGFASQKLSVIYNGLDLGRFERQSRSDPAAFGLPSSGDEKFVTLVANLRHAVKNIPMLLRTARRVSDEMVNIHFVVAGEGDLLAGLRAQATDLGVASRVHFIGPCNDIPGLLSISEACVLTSNAEGFSNSILEYMAAARPVVATSAGGAAEAIIQGETGFLVPLNDDEAMAAHLIAILQDDDLATRLGTAGRERVSSRFSTAEQLRRTLDLYDRVLAL